MLIKRHGFLLGTLLILTLGLGWRLVELTIVDRDFLQYQGNARSVRTIEVPAYRGVITDRNGAPLAISSPVRAAWLNPQVFIANDQQLTRLASLLNQPLEQLKNKIQQGAHKEFMYLARGLPPAVARDIEALKLPGVYFNQEFKRYYPEGEITSHLLGITDIDDMGQEGLELAYDQWLSGEVGKKQVLKDRIGHVIGEVAHVKKPRSGNDLTLSIDRRIQYIAYRELKKAVERHQAVSGSIVILDVVSGEILAMVNQPSFNPNARVELTPDHMRNRSITDLFEPGSVIKAFSVASVLESGQVTPDTMVDTAPGWLILNGQVIQDLQHNGQLSVSDVLRRSSNVGVAKLALELPENHLYQSLRQFGFGETSNTYFPGESRGAVVQPNQKQKLSIATLAFGYGISVTPLQLAQAYAVFARQGKFLPATLVKEGNQKQPEKQVISPQVSETVLAMLESVVDQGSARRAKVPGYRVAGKTGTSRLAGNGGYYQDKHVATFVGIAPVDHPRLVMAVVIHEPKNGSYYGGVVAAPVFSSVMTDALRLLEVSPDNSRTLA
ncbi:MAG: penicillin-binding protein 2 [Legionellales bacterium]|nr:penicillin-binding protein 2 [Legionellales bacterium]